MNEILKETTHELYINVEASYGKFENETDYKLSIDEMYSLQLPQNRLYFVEMMNQAAHKLGTNICFAPIGCNRKPAKYGEGEVIVQLGYQVNLPIDNTTLLQIFEQIRDYAHPDEIGYPFVMMALTEVSSIEFNTWYNDDVVSKWSHQFDLEDLEDEEQEVVDEVRSVALLVEQYSKAKGYDTWDYGYLIAEDKWECQFWDENDQTTEKFEVTTKEELIRRLTI